MAKTSMVEREKKRLKLVSKYTEKRDKLKKEIRSSILSGNIPWNLYIELQKLPRNSNPTRVVSRCNLCGRSRSVYKKFGMCRLCLRKNAMLGYVPGLKKASW